MNFIKAISFNLICLLIFSTALQSQNANAELEVEGTIIADSLGINVSQPDAAFHVVGDARLNGRMSLNTTSRKAVLNLGNGDTSIAIHNNTPDAVGLRINMANRFSNSDQAIQYVTSGVNSKGMLGFGVGKNSITADFVNSGAKGIAVRGVANNAIGVDAHWGYFEGLGAQGIGVFGKGEIGGKFEGDFILNDSLIYGDKDTYSNRCRHYRSKVKIRHQEYKFRIGSKCL